MNALNPHVSLDVANIDASLAFYEKAWLEQEVFFVEADLPEVERRVGALDVSAARSGSKCCG